MYLKFSCVYKKTKMITVSYVNNMRVMVFLRKKLSSQHARGLVQYYLLNPPIISGLPTDGSTTMTSTTMTSTSTTTTPTVTTTIFFSILFLHGSLLFLCLFLKKGFFELKTNLFKFSFFLF